MEEEIGIKHSFDSINKQLSFLKFGHIFFFIFVDYWLGSYLSLKMDKFAYKQHYRWGKNLCFVLGKLTGNCVFLKCLLVIISLIHSFIPSFSHSFCLLFGHSISQFWIVGFDAKKKVNHPVNTRWLLFVLIFFFKQ